MTVLPPYCLPLGLQSLLQPQSYSTSFLGTQSPTVTTSEEGEDTGGTREPNRDRSVSPRLGDTQPHIPDTHTEETGDQYLVDLCKERDKVKGEDTGGTREPN